MRVVNKGKKSSKGPPAAVPHAGGHDLLHGQTLSILSAEPLDSARWMVPLESALTSGTSSSPPAPLAVRLITRGCSASRTFWILVWLQGARAGGGCDGRLDWGRGCWPGLGLVPSFAGAGRGGGGPAAAAGCLLAHSLPLDQITNQPTDLYIAKPSIAIKQPTVILSVNSRPSPARRQVHSRG